LKDDKKLSEYSKVKAFYAGLLPLLRNLTWLAALLCSLWGFFANNNSMYILTMAALLITPMTTCIQFFCRRILAPCGFKWAIEANGAFCSSFVIMLDAKSGGDAYKKVLTTHEPRPVDVVNACK
jgi:hypothetical protein